MNQATQRLFFALWPDTNLQRALHRVGLRLQEAFGERVVAAQNIHLTLAFLGAVPIGRVGELCTIGESIRVEPFRLKLIGTGCWKRSAVGWIAPDDVPQSLENLVPQLRQLLLEAGFRVDDKPFAPHVTLLRKAKCNTQAAQQGAPLEWRIDRFVLMRSETLQTGPEYSQLRSWPLTS